MKELEKEIAELKEVDKKEKARDGDSGIGRLIADEITMEGIRGFYHGVERIQKMFEIIESLQAENKSWREMVESTNQTNQAMSKMLGKLEAENQELQSKLERAKEGLEIIWEGKGCDDPSLFAECILADLNGANLWDMQKIIKNKINGEK